MGGEDLGTVHVCCAVDAGTIAGEVSQTFKRVEGDTVAEEDWESHIQGDIEEKKEDTGSQTSYIGCTGVHGINSGFKDKTHETAGEANAEEADTANSVDHQ